MSPLRNKRCVRNRESGYVLVLIVFFLALLVLSTIAAAPTVLSKIQREREAEMVWRGKQYARGVKLYYLKMHRFPTSLEDLTKPKTGLRFMRQAYKDPVNQVDGSWRLIYVGPSGQLIGSLKDPSTNPFGLPGQVGGTAQAFGALFSASGNPGAAGSGFGNPTSASSGSGNSNSLTSFSSNLNQNSGTAQGAAVGTALQSASAPADPNAQNPESADQLGQPHALAAMDASNTIGGNIIGVGSKVNKKSFMWYEKAKNYRQFEFIWDPSKDVNTGRASVGIGTPLQSLNGTNPGGAATTNSPSGQGANPNPNPPQNRNPTGISDPNDNPPLQAPPPNQ